MVPVQKISSHATRSLATPVAFGGGYTEASESRAPKPSKSCIRVSVSLQLTAKCVFCATLNDDLLISRGGSVRFFFARLNLTLETSLELILVGTAENRFITLQLIPLTIATFVGISIGVVPVFMFRRCGDLDLCLLLKAQASLGLTYWVSAVKTAFLWSVTHTLRRKASLALSLLVSRPGVAVA